MSTGEQALPLICLEVAWVLGKYVLHYTPSLPEEGGRASPSPHWIHHTDSGSTVELTLVVGVLVSWLRGHELAMPLAGCGSWVS